MCYSGICPYEYLKADQDCGCSKPQGEPCPHEVEQDEDTAPPDTDNDD